ncbi:uncharacterized protein LOC135183933 isoform X1 [Pogoniulus pusillus]|uniref:uncharacterized protein LOC135183933 isoform X1 n=1 Tax=Pogoniulus pusillus TaxID=488313 RepID=UPI0030B94310
MSTWLLVAISGSLLLALQGSCTLAELTSRRLVAAGASVLLEAPSIANASLTDWEFIRRGTPEFILQYYADVQAPTIYPAYRGRVHFYPENGSILLQGLQEADSGIYRATVDLMRDKARTTLLEVVKPVSQPELQSSSNLAGSSIELLCVVPKGMEVSISWKKDGYPLPPEKLCLLSENSTVLQMRSGEKADCGSYSCNVSNEISWKEATMNLTVTGLTAPLHHVQRLAAVALIFIASSAASFITLLCWPRESSSGMEAWNHISLSGYILLCVCSILLLATSIIWMHEEGLSAAFFLPGLFFFGAAVGTAWKAAAVLWRPAALSHLKAHLWYHIICHSTAPTTLIVNFFFSTTLLHNIEKLHERGCSESVDLKHSCISAAVVIIMLLIVLLQYHRRKRMEMHKMKDYRARAPEVVTAVLEEPQGQVQESV